MKFLFALLLLFSSFGIYPQDSSSVKLAIDVLSFQRNFDKETTPFSKLDEEKYNLWYYGVQLSKPFHYSENFIPTLSLSYMRSFPSTWLFSDITQEKLDKEARATLYSLRANFAFKKKAFMVSPSIGVHLDQFYLEKERIHSKTKYGYGVYLGYMKKINLFKHEIYLPSIGFYKIQGIEWLWTIQLPIFYLRKND